MLRTTAVLGILALVLVPAVLADPVEPPPEPAAEPSDGSLWAPIQALYEAAKRSGESHTGSITEWLKSDYEKIGDWEYRIVRVPSKESGVLESSLNLEGSDRWEVFWVREGAGDFTFFLKRPVRSYLRSIPVSELLKLIPGGGAAE
jgi:hypothetical protein